MLTVKENPVAATVRKHTAKRPLEEAKETTLNMDGDVKIRLGPMSFQTLCPQCKENERIRNVGEQGMHISCNNAVHFSGNHLIAI